MNHFGEPQNRLGTQPTDSTSKDELVQSVARSQWREFIGWIDPLKDDDQIQSAYHEFERRWNLQPHSPAPLETLQAGERVAGAYMMLLGARVAALAGVRGIDNHNTTAARLLNQLVQEVRAQGVVQVQAILDGTESIATEIVELAGFVPLAELQQLALPLNLDTQSKASSSSDEGLCVELPESLKWVKACDVPRAKLTQLLAHTFIETLDCPALNGLRTPDDVLEGFLDGQELAAQTHWWLLESGDRFIGCVLVNKLPSGAAELVYMGLGPTSRGRGYGRLLLEQGIRNAMAMQADVFLAAVDCANWPANRLYLQAGFQEHGRVQAWFHVTE